MPTAPPTHRPKGWQPRTPYGNSRTAAQRITGRTLQTRNARIQQRDAYQCQACKRITTKGQVDHIKPLAQGGNEDDANLQWLCLPCHAIKSIGEQEGGASFHPEWLPMPACRVVVVCGPPGGGKTTYSQQQAKAGDEVIDLDECFREVCGVHGHDADRKFLHAATRRRNSLIARLAHKRRGTAFLIVSAPTQAERQWWQDKLGAEIVLCDPGHRVTFARVTGKRMEAARGWYDASLLNHWGRSKAVHTLNRGEGMVQEDHTVIGGGVWSNFRGWQP